MNYFTSRLGATTAWRHPRRQNGSIIMYSFARLVWLENNGRTPRAAEIVMLHETVFSPRSI